MCPCSQGREVCNCGLAQDPIPTDWGDIEDEKSRMSGLVVLLGYALGIVSLIGALALAL